jgi:hypothetical protein
MFENLNQSKEQNLAGNNNSPLTPGPLKPSAPAPVAPKVEDMFASVKDTASQAGKNTPTIPSASKMSMTEIKSSGNGLRTALIIVVILIVIGLGAIIAVRFLGLDLSNPSSWAGKFSNLSSLFVKEKPGQTVVINNETPASVVNHNNATQQPTAPAVQTPTATNPATTATGTNPAAPASAIPNPANPAPVVPNPANPVSTASSSTAVASSSTALVDGDGDGLSNPEEVALGTDPLKIDTDGDSYGDKVETNNLFNALGAGAITANPNISEYNNSKQNYAVLYPKIFSIQDVLNNDGSVISFSAPATGSFTIEISVQPNAAKQDVLAFFNQQFPGNTAKDSDIISKNGLQGLFSPDKNKYYATDDAKSKFYIVTYNGNGNLSYYNIFLLIVHSLKEILQ